MAETLSKTQLPLNTALPPPGADQSEMFAQGLAAGREWAATAALRLRPRAEENPGQFLLAGLAAGFLVGKLLFRPRRRLGR